jgi:hypothetical protein
MNELVGQEGEVSVVDAHTLGILVRFENGDSWYFPFFVLEPAIRDGLRAFAQAVKVLVRGGRLKTSCGTIGMEDDGTLYVVGHKDTPDGPEEVHLFCDVDLKRLVDLANEMGHDELWLRSCADGVEDMITRVGFTGTRRGMTGEQKIHFAWVLSAYEAEGGIQEFHHGDCVGADSEAHDIVSEVLPNARIYIHPPLDSRYRANRQGYVVRNPLHYLDRNRNIVDASDVLIATPGEETEQLRSGTWSTVRYARKQGKRVFVIYPSGTEK